MNRHTAINAPLVCQRSDTSLTPPKENRTYNNSHQEVWAQGRWHSILPDGRSAPTPWKTSPPRFFQTAKCNSASCSNSTYEQLGCGHMCKQLPRPPGPHKLRLLRHTHHALGCGGGVGGSCREGGSARLPRGQAGAQGEQAVRQAVVLQGRGQGQGFRGKGRRFGIRAGT